jgi:hypothetical protein
MQTEVNTVDFDIPTHDKNSQRKRPNKLQERPTFCFPLPNQHEHVRSMTFDYTGLLEQTTNAHPGQESNRVTPNRFMST